ncbi:MAG TPA: arsenite methyltransferase [Patescibacteria group bacterium]|nr:arsenite methyltransferase [Patescibacteria group bacterium]
MTDQLELDSIQRQVRDRYAGAALAAADAAAAPSNAVHAAGCCGDDAGCGCGDACCGTATTTMGLQLYDVAERAGLPDAAVLASLGCGNPIAVADLREGETVLDLGSGGGIDVLLSARRVGPTGHAIGVDMTDEMLELARRNAAEAGATNVEFRKGTIERLPVDDGAVDVVISNCVINLASDKRAVFGEIARVLKPGGRVGVTDIVADDILTAEQRADRGSYVGCIAGALSFREFRAGLRDVGLTDIEVVPTRQVTEGMHSAIVRATKPA